MPTDPTEPTTLTVTEVNAVEGTVQVSSSWNWTNSAVDNFHLGTFGIENILVPRSPAPLANPPRRPLATTQEDLRNRSTLMLKRGQRVVAKHPFEARKPSGSIYSAVTQGKTYEFYKYEESWRLVSAIIYDNEGRKFSIDEEFLELHKPTCTRNLPGWF